MVVGSFSKTYAMTGFRIGYVSGPEELITPMVKEFWESSESLAAFLLKKEKVITVRGSAFGKYGEGYLRFSYATAYDKIEEALNRIERATKDFSQKRAQFKDFPPVPSRNRTVLVLSRGA